jgi:ketosteroid isomerase-like protein
MSAKSKRLINYEGTMKKRILVVALALGVSFGALIQNGFAQADSSQAATAPKQTAPKQTKPVAAGAINKAYLQKIWDGWATLDPSHQKQYYAQGPHVFFDDEPLKYNNWDEYQSTTAKELAEYKSGSFKVNDDAQIHKSGDIYWATATVAADMTQKSGKREQETFRWTVIFEKQNGKWIIVHEHVSVPQQ